MVTRVAPTAGLAVHADDQQVSLSACSCCSISQCIGHVTLVTTVMRNNGPKRPSISRTIMCRKYWILGCIVILLLTVQILLSLFAVTSVSDKSRGFPTPDSKHTVRCSYNHVYPCPNDAGCRSHQRQKMPARLKQAVERKRSQWDHDPSQSSGA